MVDIAKQIAYWRDGALEDMEVAEHLVGSGRTRHGLFLTHLALEKILKALVCKNTNDLAPKLHSLLSLTRMACISPSQEHLDILAVTNDFNIIGRYPETLGKPPTKDEAVKYLNNARGVFEWLMNQL